MGVVACLPLIMGGVMKLMHGPEVIENFKHLELPDTLMTPLGVLDLALCAVYLFPRTAVLGAILATGYFGGAILTHLRIGEPFIVEALVGVFLWGGLFLRDARIRALVPFVKS